jgi:hypothetical protein
MAFAAPSDPQDFAIRPLNKGIILDQPSQTLPKEACVDAVNYIIDKYGPRRRPGWEMYGRDRIRYRLIDMFTFWTSETGDESQITLVITDGPLYRVAITGVEEIPWDYDTGTVTVTGDAVEGFGTAFTDEGILPGDILEIGEEIARVLEVADNTHITLREATITDTGAAVGYRILRSFNESAVHMPDFVVYNNEVVFTDFNRPLFCFNPTNAPGSQLEYYINIDDYKIDSGSGPEDFVASCIAMFQDRLYVGYTLEPTDGLRRQRIRWSTATNPRDFSDATAWMDLPYTQGAIRRLVPLSNTLIAYFDDAVFVGTPTTNPYLPVYFQKVEMGGVGLVGMKAITSFLDSHFFVGQDDVYQMSSTGPQKLESPVVDATLRDCEVRERIYVVVDPENDRVMFGFPKLSYFMEVIWSMSYITGGWSREELQTYMIASPLINLSLGWDDLTGTWEDLEDTFPTWDDMDYNERHRAIYSENNGYIRKLGVDSVQDVTMVGEDEYTYERIVSPITAVYETPDFDLDDPDGIKTFLRLSMKVTFSAFPPGTSLFSVQASWNRGRNWEALGNVEIETGYDEGYINFLMTSSHVRFRITTFVLAAPFRIDEICLKIRTRGREVTTGFQSPGV